jgi:hypothetical protein
MRFALLIQEDFLPLLQNPGFTEAGNQAPFYTDYYW